MPKLMHSLAIVISLLSSASPSLAMDYQTYRQFFDTATACEHECKWQRINWLTNIKQAQAVAQHEHKPILVFMVLGFKNQKGAGDV